MKLLDEKLTGDDEKLNANQQMKSIRKSWRVLSDYVVAIETKKVVTILT